MRRLAGRWLNDCVTLRTVTVSAGTRADPDGTTTLGTAYTVAASVRPVTLNEEEGDTVRRNVRDLSVWIDDTDLTVTPAGDWRCTITACRDSTLTGEVGTVVAVERDPHRAVRRLTVRLPNDA